MREIALRADLSLGAAYHYFTNKEAIVLADYAHVQRQHVELTRRALATTSDVRDRLAATMHTKLWALHMRILLYFLYDQSPNQLRTRRLADGAMALVVRMLPVSSPEAACRPPKRRLRGFGVVGGAARASTRRDGPVRPPKPPPASLNVGPERTSTIATGPRRVWPV